MKKLLIATALAAAVTSANAIEVGVNGSYDHISPNYYSTGFGFTVGQRFGNNWGVTAGLDRYTETDINRYSVLGGYDAFRVGAALFTFKAGAAYVDRGNNLPNGYAGVVGIASTIYVTDKVGIVVDYRYQRGQDRISNLNGNTVSLGVQYSF